LAEFTNPNQQSDGHSWLVLILLLAVALIAFHAVQAFRQRPHALPLTQQAFAPETSIVAKPFFVALRWIHNHVVANWGWAIVLLTLCINLALTPTRVMAMRSQLKMQRIQPQLSVIRSRYKDVKITDPRQQEMQREILDLQRKEGVNMLGGMVPLLVQMPLLYGFYRMLHTAAELHHAPWLWLHDLSAPDPFHILPILFVATMFVLQLLTPAPGTDPTQRKLMALIYPIFGLFMTWSAAAGLALYWAFGNLINILQQLAISRTRLGREAARP